MTFISKVWSFNRVTADWKELLYRTAGASVQIHINQRLFASCSPTTLISINHSGKYICH